MPAALDFLRNNWFLALGIGFFAWTFANSFSAAARAANGYGWRDYAGLIVTLGMLCLFAYGFILYPDAPLHPCTEHGYCGKQGQPHSFAEYHAFNLWQTALLAVWPLGIGLSYLLGRRKN